MAALCPCLLYRCWRTCQWLAVELIALACAAGLALRPAWARAPIVVQCGDAAARRATAAVLRRALRDAQRVLDRAPMPAVRLRVLATAGTPPDFADLGQALAVCRVRRLPDGPRAVVTLAAAADGRRLTADQLVVALAAALDWLDGWRPDGPDAWTLPARAGAAPARLAHDLLRWPPARPGAAPSSPVLPEASPPREPAGDDPAGEAPADDPLGLGGA